MMKKSIPFLVLIITLVFILGGVGYAFYQQWQPNPWDVAMEEAGDDCAETDDDSAGDDDSAA